MALAGKLSHPQRYITTHNNEGQAVFDRSLSADAPYHDLPDKDASFAQCYVTSEFPVTLDGQADLKTYEHFLTNPPGLVSKGGTVLRYVDIAPGTTSAMHRTISLDYGVVLEGKVELILDSGETECLNVGDICVQRSTMHSWRNTSDEHWARMLYVLQPCTPFSVNGQELKEDYGTMSGVKASV